MRALQLQDQQPIENKPLVFVEIDTPEPGNDQVLIRVKACGVCHTDLHTVEGDIRPPNFPIIPGHQVVGEVVSVSSRRGELPGNRKLIRAGDRVGVPWLHSACGKCEYCRQGKENLCDRAKFTGFHVNGGYAEYLVADSRYVLPIPEEISDLHAAPLLCAGIIGYRSLKLAEIRPGQRLGLVGFGASAHLAIQVAKTWGVEVFVYTRSPGHRQHALDLGADWVGSIDEPVRNILNSAIIFAPSGTLVPLTLDKLKPGGTLAINAIHMSPIPELPYSLIYNERTVRSVANATYQDGLDFLQIAASVPIHPDIIVYAPDKANQALIDLKTSQISGEAVISFY